MKLIPLSLGIIAAAGLIPAPRIEAATPTLVWSDEFSLPAGSAPDAAKWAYDLGAGGWGNNELQTYTSSRDNSVVVVDPDATDQRALALTARRGSGGGYTSARLKTQGLYSVGSGRIEARLRMTDGKGIWPAFWMLGDRISSLGWPACGEIDVIEAIGARPTMAYGTLHGPGYSGQNAIGGHANLPGGGSLADGYHVFAIDWSPGRIEWSLDGSVYHTVTRSTIPAGARWVFDDATFFLLLNVAVGGNWPGYPDSTTPFPQTLRVDYVRVYGAAPAAPGRLVGYASSSSEATLTWEPASAAEGYRLERALDSGFTQSVARVDVGAVTSRVDPGLQPGTTYHYRVSALRAGGVSDPTATLSVRTPATAPSGSPRLVNLGTRAYGGTDERVAIGGFVIGGTGSRRVLLRTLGPTLAARGLPAAQTMADPTVMIHDAGRGNAVVATNNDWRDNADLGSLEGAAAQAGAGALAPDDSRSSAVLLTLPAGVYTCVARDRNSGSGVMLIEAFDADPAAPGSARLTNLSSRVYCASDERVAIGGFVLAGTGRKRLLLRAVGPTLASRGLEAAQVLPDPTLELHDMQRSGAVIAVNDNAGDNANAAEVIPLAARIGAAPLDASDTRSAALLLDLSAGVYSFVVRDRAGGGGIVLIEAYDAD